MNIEVVELSENGIPLVLDIQRELAIGPDILDRGEKVAPNGLLISGHTEDDFRAYLLSGGRLFGAYDSDELVGYVFIVPGKHFVDKIADVEIEWEKGVDGGQADEFVRSGDYLYLDQIAVRWSYQKRGVSDDLLQRVENEFLGQTFLALVIISPIDNIRSRNFFTRKGFKKFCEIVFPRYGTMASPRGILFKKR